MRTPAACAASFRRPESRQTFSERTGCGPVRTVLPVRRRYLL